MRNRIRGVVNIADQKFLNLKMGLLFFMHDVPMLQNLADLYINICPRFVIIRVASL